MGLRDYQCATYQVDGIVHSLIINIILTISDERKAEIKDNVINKLNISKERV